MLLAHMLPAHMLPTHFGLSAHSLASVELAISSDGVGSADSDAVTGPVFESGGEAALSAGASHVVLR